MQALRALFTTHSRARRRLLVSLGAALLVIVGLVAMHGFNIDTGHASTGGAMETSANVAEHHPSALRDSGPGTAACADDCGDAGHLGMAMVCVLALLAAVFALTIPPAESLARLRDRLQQRFESWVGSRAPLRPPSLIALSISRT
jgi:hypothetical protein